MRQTDAAGNLSGSSDALAYTLDSAGPSVTITDNVSGTANGVITYTFTFSEAVTGFSAADITVANGTKGVFTQLSDTAFTLTVTPDAAEEGNVTVDVAAGAAQDLAGNNSLAATQSSQPFDTLAPSAPSVGSLAALTNDNTVVISITAAAGSTVRVYDGTTLLGIATEEAAGNFSLTTTPLADGAHSITATATDATGNLSSASAAVAFTVDTQPPAAPTLALESDTGSSSTDGITSSLLYTSSPPDHPSPLCLRVPLFYSQHQPTNTHTTPA